jgi:YVTN family beta-propeller protein
MAVIMVGAAALSGCKSHGVGVQPPAVSSTIALTSNDSALWVVTPDADSVSVIDPRTRALVAEVALGAAPPAVDPATMRYEPSVKPRALAISPDDKKVYVAGQTANAVFVVDAVRHTVLTSIPVGAEPTGIVASQDGHAVYVVNHQSATVSKIDTSKDMVVATLPVGEHPWGASISADGTLLYVSQFLLHPGVTVVDTKTFTVRNVVELAEQSPDASNGKLAPNGVPRGVYAAVPRPVGGDVWMPHLLLAVQTPEPNLDFQSTVFPTVSTLSSDGTSENKRLLFEPLGIDVQGGAFNDVVSGPRAIAFSPDGKLAFMANSGSEDVMVFDGESGNERFLVRPLPATFLEGIVVDHAGTHAYVDGRNTHNVVVLTLAPSDPIEPVKVDGAPIDRLQTDPMPSDLRLGQRLFYTANSAAFPLTQNFWMSCSTCHLEGQTDAVTWLFLVGPRDTPSNAGGPINTGFLLRQALRRSVAEYDTTINLEQGGFFHRTASDQQPLLDALSAFVNRAIPFPQNPSRAPGGMLTAQQMHGEDLFLQNCRSCHSGEYLTDSGQGNPTLDLNGTILLHDIGTCNTGAFPDKPAPDEVVGKMHSACDFDTPTLRGIFATAPYFHDGSAATLKDAVDRLPAAAMLSGDDRAALVEYLKTL